MRRKKQKNNFLKKIIIILFIIISFFGLKYCVEAIENKKIEKNIQITKSLNTEKSKKIDEKLKKIFGKIEKQKNNLEQKYIYSKLIKILNKKVKNQKNNFSLNYIIQKIKEKNNSIILEKKVFKKHNTKILKFKKNANHKNILDNFLQKNNKEKIKSVFIFKQNSDLSRKDIKYITKKLKKYNKDILIFIDQEGGLINRYVEFEKNGDIEEFFSKNKYEFLKKRYKKLNNKEIKIIRNIFPKKYGYFPTLLKIGKTYDIFSNKEKKIAFLDIIAFIRLQTLKNNGINTYGLVLDLNRGNPVISNNFRSFSKHLWKYKELVNSFLKASRNTKILLYAKHFPGHGDGKIDSHLGILNLSGKEKYLKENLELFEYFLEKEKITQKGLMVGHMYIPKILEKKFNEIIKKSDFLLTDDLAMNGYKLANKKKKKNLFFTTDKIIKLKNTIIVDTVNIGKIK